MKCEPVETTLTPDSVCKPSEEVVSRDVMGELIIVPIASGIGDMENEIYTMNETGSAIWNRLDGKATLGEIAQALAKEFEAPPGDIERDVHGIAAELVWRRMVVAV